MMKSSRILFLIALSLVFSIPAFSQGTATIHGTVRDQSGAVIPGASVSIVNIGSNQTRKLTTDSQGTYVAPLLPVGTYSLRVEAKGFSPFLRTGITVAVNLNVEADATLALASNTSKVTVSSAAPLVQTVTTNLVQIVDHKEMINLPLNGRNVLQLTALAAGVTDDPRVEENVLQGSTVGQGLYNVVISANGARPNQNNYLLDGVDNLDRYTNINEPYPNPDAVQEFSIQTSSFDAQYGQGVGAVVNVITRSGTNSLHGSLFEFLRNYDMNARNFFTGVDSLKRNQFGFAVGGPVVIPHVYNGKNKTFLFGSYQGTRQVIATSKIVTAPSAAMEQGDFSAWLGAGGKGVVNDPLSRQAFPLNQIPASRFDPISAKLLNYLPPSISSNYLLAVPTPSTPTDDNQALIRVDHNISDRQRVSFRYFQLGYDNHSILLPHNLYWMNVGSNDTYKSAVLTHTYIFSPNLLNEFNIAVHRSTSVIIPPDSLSACCTLSNLGGRVETIPHDENLVLSISGWFGIPDYFYRVQDEDTGLISDNINYIFGKNTLKFGGAVERYRIDYGPDGFDTDPDVSFGGLVTATPGKSNPGNAFADYLLGAFSTFRQQSLSGYRLYNTYPSLYVQDDIRVTHKLSLNAGLRWEPTFFPKDKYNQVTMFSPGSQSVAFPNAPPNLLFYGDPGVGSPFVHADWSVFAPRFGLAYRLTPQTVIRGAYGIFNDQYMMISSNRTMQAPPWVHQVVFGATGYLSNPYGAGTPINVEHATPKKDVPFLPYSTFALPSASLRPGYVQDWNFVVQRQVARNLAVQAAYVGSKATHLLVGAAINPALYGPGATLANENQRRIYPLIGHLQLGEGAGWSTYESGRLSLTKRFSHNFMAKANYTYSKSIDIASYGTIEGNNIGPNPFNWNANRGPSDFDYTQRFVMSSIWVLPQLKGKSAFLRAVIGGWQSNFIFTAQSGTPLTIVSGVDNSLSGVGGDFADLTGIPWKLPGDRPEGAKIQEWFNTAAFTQNAIGTHGTGGRNQLRVPGMWDLDYSLFKDFALTEGIKLELRGEAFNVLNHTNLGAPSGTVTSPRFGTITSAGDPRILQVAMKLLF